MSLTNSAEAALLNLIFKNQAWANIGDASGLQPSSADGNFYISLHTSDPGESGNQSTNEVSYTSYARVAVPRGSGFSTATGGDPTETSNASAIQFPVCTGGTATATHFGIGTSSTGTGNLILKGALNASLAISSGVRPEFAAGDLKVSAS